MSRRSLPPAAVAALAVLAGAGACGRAPNGEGDPHVWAERLYETRCQSCHGVAGGGDGPAAAGLAAPPRDFTDAGWQDVVTDERIRRVIVRGGAASGLSPLMPKNPDLRGQPELVEAMLTRVRRFGNRAPAGPVGDGRS